MSQPRSLLPMTESPIRDLNRPSLTRRQGGEALPPALCALTPGSQPHRPPLPRPHKEHLPPLPYQ